MIRVANPCPKVGLSRRSQHQRVVISQPGRWEVPKLNMTLPVLLMEPEWGPTPMRPVSKSQGQSGSQVSSVDIAGLWVKFHCLQIQFVYVDVKGMVPNLSYGKRALPQILQFSGIGACWVNV